MIGSKLVFNPPGRWDETEFLRLTQQHRISAWSGVPTQYWRILGHPDLDTYDVSSVRSAGGGGAVFQPELIRLMKEKFPHIGFGTGYGMSETTGLGTTLGGQMQIDFADSVGIAQVGCEVEVRDLDGRHRPRGRGGRDLPPHRQHVHRLLEQPGGDRGGVRRRPLVPHGRLRAHLRRQAASSSRACAT